MEKMFYGKQSQNDLFFTGITGTTAEKLTPRELDYQGS